MNSKRALYAERIDERSDEECELLMLFPRTIYADEKPLPVEELERIRADVAKATRISRGLEKRRA